MDEPQNRRDRREKANKVSGVIIDAAIAVHRELGPGLLESVYEQALAFEFSERGMFYERQKPLPIRYRDTWLNGEFRLDFVVEGQVIIELKSVLNLEPVHEAQLLTYLKLSGTRLGLLLNFNVKYMHSGIKRLVLDF